MCVTCGCGTPEASPHDHEHSHDHHDRSHPHPHSHAPTGRLISIEQDILAKNAGFAGENRRLFAARGVFALNLVSSPGSGKTTLLSQTVRALGTEFPVAVIGGDQQTANDAERIRAAGAPAVQINTGKGCHLDAHGVGHALEQLPLPEGGILFIENVGNLVCPADFDLGEAHKVVVLSVTEGEDKPLKYANMFAAADLMLLNKIDLLPHVDFDVAQCLDYARRVNSTLQILQLSARTGEGMAAWLDWLRQGQQATLAQQAARLEAELAAVRARLARTAG
ncbi:MAG: hydrogenase nickel incorporation protein HypB [Candidatus Contendobacter sp.]|jgi:hydrogenase nickel incorporation protein HypB|nr:hydrogenase nickel incorporation protein HypB [Gammaproteobacteria bacterium]MCC8993032.1 hydrogenase nickel incorporation protein HypB [Candidatus Contendobacter sp.]